MAINWKRPDSVPFPSTWCEFEGKKKINGDSRKYWIQDLTEDHMDWAMYWLELGLLKESPLCKYTGFGVEDMEEAKEIWKGFIRQRLSLICLTNGEDGKPTIAGYNFCRISTYLDKKIKCKSIQVQNFLDTVSFLSSTRDPFKELKITEFLSGIGLFVLPEFRGEALGLELLKARVPLCKAVGLKATLTVFSSFISQKLAERCGFTEFYSIDFDELMKIHPEFKLDGIKEHTQVGKYMCMMIK